jgi:hypothetical protein
LDLSVEETPFQERLTEQLTSGAFHYAVVAQHFTPTMERTVEYLNSLTSDARFYAVELVRFAADKISAFESRTVLKPAPPRTGSAGVTVNEVQFLEQIGDDAYREALREFLDFCHGLGLRFSWGTAGTSIRVPIPNRKNPLSVAWLFPPGGWVC